MDDFLYNLRRESDKRNRRQSGQQNYRGPDRRGPKDQRRGYARRNEVMEALPEIKTLLETLVENQKQLLENDGRKTQALEDIALVLQAMTGKKIPAREEASVTMSPAPEVVEPETPPSSDDTVNVATEVTPSEETNVEQPEEKPLRSKREDVKKIALSLREEGKTYKEIAQYLVDNEIPTFSGKGGWHAPTIHKLCKQDGS